MIDFSAAQRRLIRAGYEIGDADNIPGTKTWAGIFAYVSQRPLSALLPFGEAAKVYLHEAGIDQSSNRIANFVGQAAHESNGFRNMREIWGPTSAQIGYEGRKDLGNTQPGDGKRFCGRGIFQLTGRGNYREIGQRLGLDLENAPTLAETPAVAVQTAAAFWSKKGLNGYVDAGHEDTVTEKINGGSNGMNQRRALVARAKGLFL